jgi:CRP-like cAMP-binding protein
LVINAIRKQDGDEASLQKRKKPMTMVNGSMEINLEKALRELNSLRELSELEIRQLSVIANENSYASGEILFHEGEHHERVHFVSSGQIVLEMATAGCGNQKIMTLGSGDLLAWTALVGGEVMTATAMAGTAVTTLSFDGGQLRSLLAGQPTLGYRFMNVVASALAKRLLATRLQLLDFYHHA